MDVVALSGKARGFGARIAFGEVAPVIDAAGDRKAPLPRRQRKLRRRENIPQYEGAAEVRVARVAAIVGKPELARRERANRLRPLEAILERGVGRRLDHF